MPETIERRKFMQLLAAIVPAAFLAKFGLKEAPSQESVHVMNIRGQELAKHLTGLVPSLYGENGRLDFIDMKYWGKSAAKQWEEQQQTIQQLMRDEPLTISSRNIRIPIEIRGKSRA